MNITTVDTKLRVEASFVGLCIWLLPGTLCAFLPRSSTWGVVFMSYRYRWFYVTVLASHCPGVIASSSCLQPSSAIHPHVLVSDPWRI